LKHLYTLPGFSRPGEPKRASSGDARRIGPPLLVLLVAVLLAAALDAGQPPPKPQLSAAHKAWLEDEAVYIITATEKSVFMKLWTDRERELFIEAFWKQRDPTPGTPENEFKTEHFRRIAYADRVLGRETSRPGRKTDRGRIHIILGEPQDIERYEGKSSTYDTEVWFYQGKTALGLPPAFYVVFFKESGSGEFRLYSPIADGPQALMSGYLGDMDPTAAYEKLREIEPNLAEISLSLVPGEAGTVYGKPSMTADLLIQRIASAPSVESRYAQKFLDYKDLVEVEYTANYIDNASLIRVFKDPSGPYFVHYAVQPQRLSVGQRDRTFYTTLKVNGRVSAAGGRLVYQFDKSVVLNLTEAQMDEANRVPFDLQDLFPLVGGDYTVSLLIKNEVSKEFTSVERTLRIPEAGKAVQLTQPLLGYRAVRLEPAARRMKAFRIGAYQIFCQPDRTFSRPEALAVAFQVHNLTGDAAAAAEIRLEFLKDGQPFRSLVRKPSDYADLPDVLEEVPLSDFPPAHYAVKVAVASMGTDIVSATEEFDVSFADRLPRPWFFSRVLPDAGDPAYSGIIGLQLFNLGRLAEAQTLLESVFARLPGSEDAAAALARVYLGRNAAPDAVRTLAPFIDPARTPKYETYILAAQALRRARELEKAVAALERAVERYGINAALMNLMGECLAELGKVPEALAAFEKSLVLSPDQPSVRAKIEELKKRK